MAGIQTFWGVMFNVFFCFVCRYESPQHIMEEFFTLRMEFYHRRKASLLDKMQSEWSKLDNKVGSARIRVRIDG